MNEQLFAHLAWIRALLSFHLRRLQAAGVLPGSDDGSAGALIEPDEIVGRISGTADPRHRPDSDWLRSSEAALQSAEAAARASLSKAPTAPMAVIRARTGLDDLEFLLLCVALAGELDPDTLRLGAFVQNHFERQYLSGGLLVDAVLGRETSPEIWTRLDGEAPLIRYGLLRCDIPPHGPAAHQARLQAPLRPTPRLVRAVLHGPTLDSSLTNTMRWNPVGSEPPAVIGEADRAAWSQLSELASRDLPAWELPHLLLSGATGSGRTRWVAEIASAVGQGTLRIDLPALTAEAGSVEAALTVAFREGLLLDAIPCLVDWESVIDTDGAAVRCLARWLEQHRGTCAIIARTQNPELPNSLRPWRRFDVHRPDTAALATLWDRHLPASRRAVEPAVLATALPFPPGTLIDVAEHALSHADQSGEPLTIETVTRAARMQQRHRLGDITTWIEPRYRWADLIVDPEVTLQLQELIGRYEHRSTVLQGWGFGDRFGADLGMSALFDGPPGTGKTMAASIVAQELGLDLYQIDLSRVMSRYIGETEKNLGRIFDEAEHGRVLLLFDEADSLFSKRTTVKSANDRYANLEVNYLLQRIEQFSGLAVLTTNFAASIDEAFVRRLSTRITFPAPAAAERARLWRSMLTGRGGVADGIDYEQLASDYELPGGHIRNAVLRAAFIAAQRGGHVDDELLSVAARIELKLQGKLVRGRPLMELANRTERNDEGVA